MRVNSDSPFCEKIIVFIVYVLRRCFNPLGEVFVLWLWVVSMAGISNNTKVVNFRATNSYQQLPTTVWRFLKWLYKGFVISLKTIVFTKKKAGVIVHDISPGNQFLLNMFDRLKPKHLIQAYDTINNKKGRDTLRCTIQGFDRKWKQ